MQQHSDMHQFPQVPMEDAHHWYLGPRPWHPWYGYWHPRPWFYRPWWFY